MSKLCGHCNAHRVLYRKDYPSSDERAYRIHHARGCPNFGKIPPSKQIEIIHHTCPTWGVTNCNLSLFNRRAVKTSLRWSKVTCTDCLRERSRPWVKVPELSEFEKWWDEFAKKRLYWQPRDMPTLCGIAKDAWNAAIEQSAGCCEIHAELEGAKQIRKCLKA